MTGRKYLREAIDAKYPYLAKLPLDWAMRRVREIQAQQREYWASINAGHAGEDEAYERALYAGQFDE